jgi:hypothetical protein
MVSVVEERGRRKKRRSGADDQLYGHGPAAVRSGLRLPFAVSLVVRWARWVNAQGRGGSAP